MSHLHHRHSSTFLALLALRSSRERRSRLRTRLLDGGGFPAACQLLRFHQRRQLPQSASASK